MRLLFTLGLAIFSVVAQASPWPIEAAVAYMDEFSLACAKAEPESASRYEAKKNSLFAENMEEIKQARASKIYPDMRKWASDKMRDLSAKTMAEECRSFLADSSLALKQVDPEQRGESIPVK